MKVQKGGFSEHDSKNHFVFLVSFLIIKRNVCALESSKMFFMDPLMSRTVVSN